MFRRSDVYGAQPLEDLEYALCLASFADEVLRDREAEFVDAPQGQQFSLRAALMLWLWLDQKCARCDKCCVLWTLVAVVGVVWCWCERRWFLYLYFFARSSEIAATRPEERRHATLCNYAMVLSDMCCAHACCTHAMVVSVVLGARRHTLLL